MSKDLEIVEHQSLALYIANKNNIKAILSQNQHTTLNIIDIFNLGVIVGKLRYLQYRQTTLSVIT